MTFKTLSALLESHNQLQEAAGPSVDGADERLGLGPKPHPILSRAELVRFMDKLDQANNKLEEVRSIFKAVPDATGPAHKLHHIGAKGGFDMGAFDDVVKKLDALENAIDELHQSWGIQMQSETGALDDDPEGPAAEMDAMEPEADTDDLPPEDEAPAATPPTK
jgi:hypothetical protein